MKLYIYYEIEVLLIKNISFDFSRMNNVPFFSESI